jgi:hypothetical protein
MILYRVIGIALLGFSVAAAQQPAQPQQPTTATQQPPNPDDKVSCRINREGNSLKRICLTKAQWRKLDAQSHDVDESGFRNPRCPMGAC